MANIRLCGVDCLLRTTAVSSEAYLALHAGHIENSGVFFQTPKLIVARAELI